MSSTKTCIIHIGVNKTGSSSLQAALHSARDLLKENGILYPGISSNHLFLWVCLVDDPALWPIIAKQHMNADKNDQDFRKECLDYLEEILADIRCDTTIFSSEFLCELDHDGCRRLRDRLAPLFTDIKIVCYLRHPKAHALSMAQHAAKSGWRSLTVTAQEPTFFRPSRLEATFVDVFGPEAVVVRPFDGAQLLNGDIVDDFCATIDLPHDVSDRIDRIRINESLSLEAALIADAIAEDLPLADNGQLNTQRSRLLQPALLRISGRAFALPQEVLDPLEPVFEAEVAYVQERFGINLQPPDLPEPADEEAWSDDTRRDIGLQLNRLGGMVEDLRRQNALLTATLLLARGKPDLARERLIKKMRNLTPTAEYYRLLARIDIKLGQRKRALETAGRGVTRFPDDDGLRDIFKNLRAPS